MTSNSQFYSLAVLQNGLLASSAGIYENAIKIWNASTGILVKTLAAGQTGYVYSMAVLKISYF